MKYISRYSNNKEVSAAQYITEIICEQKAKKDKVDLHYKFWTNKKWSLFYRNQIGSANKLLQTYSAKAIIKALLSKEGQKIFSLRAPHLPAMIQDAESQIAQENSTLTKHIDRKDSVVFKDYSSSIHHKKNIISRLEDIDNDT
jgi:ABC-type Fe3+ transport system substrate-binding protein